MTVFDLDALDNLIDKVKELGPLTIRPVTIDGEKCYLMTKNGFAAPEAFGLDPATPYYTSGNQRQLGPGHDPVDVGVRDLRPLQHSDDVELAHPEVPVGLDGDEDIV